jgi:hypothetical protein
LRTQILSRRAFVTGNLLPTSDGGVDAPELGFKEVVLTMDEERVFRE